MSPRVFHHIGSTHTTPAFRHTCRISNQSRICCIHRSFSHHCTLFAQFGTLSVLNICYPASSGASLGFSSARPYILVLYRKYTCTLRYLHALALSSFTGLPC